MPQHPPIEAAVPEARDEAHPTAEQISALIELVRSCGVDLMHFGQHMRQLRSLPAETKITKKFLREAMTLGQYEEAWQHYHELLKPHLMADVLDYPPPKDGVRASAADAGPDSERQQTEPSSTSEASSEGSPPAVPQLARPELLAQHVGGAADADGQDLLEPSGGILIHEDVTPRRHVRQAVQ